MLRCAIVIDDNEAVLFLHELMIRESGLAEPILTFKNAELALQHLARPEIQEVPHLIFLDINMPRMNGWDFLKKMQKLQPPVNIPVVMVTSSIRKADREEAAKYPQVIHFVEKPLSLQLCEELKIGIFAAYQSAGALDVR